MNERWLYRPVWHLRCVVRLLRVRKPHVTHRALEGTLVCVNLRIPNMRSLLPFIPRYSMNKRNSWAVLDLLCCSHNIIMEVFTTAPYKTAKIYQIRAHPCFIVSVCWNRCLTYTGHYVPCRITQLGNKRLLCWERSLSFASFHILSLEPSVLQ